MLTGLRCALRSCSIPSRRRVGWAPGPGVAFTALAVILVVGLSAAPALAETPRSGAEPVPSFDRSMRDIQAELPAIDEIRGPRIELAPPPHVPGAPPLLSFILGGTFYDNYLNCQRIFIPPDPIGAAGPNHVVAVTNVMVEWYDKTGAGVNRQCLSSFYAPLNPTSYPFDPKVIYDQHHGRFVVVALIYDDTWYGDPADISQILVAVSQTSDPNAGWYFHAINSKLTFQNDNVGAVTDHWADYPGLAVDDEAVYITNNMFSFGATGQWFGDAYCWIVHKAGFYTGGPATVTVHDPTPGAGWTEFTLQPAHIFGPNPAGNGTFLTSAWWSDDWSLSPGDGSGDEYLHLIRIDDPVGAPTFTWSWVSVGNIENQQSTMTNAPQAPCLPIHPDERPIWDIETNDRRMLHAVWRDGVLWCTATIWPQFGADTDQATAHWWKIDTSGFPNEVLLDQGNVGGEDIDQGTFTFFPSIAVDACGNMALGFSASGPSIWGGAYYTGRLAADPPGFTQTPGLIVAGMDCYMRTFCSSRNRWGDYSGICLDPVDEATFWAYNEFALERDYSTSCTFPPDTTRYREYGNWGTAWGAFRLNTPPVAQCKDVTSCSGLVNATHVDDGSYDPDGDPLTFTLIPPGPYPPGATNVQLVVFDGCHRDTCLAVVSVNQAPVALCQDLTVVGDSTVVCTNTSVTAADVDNGSFDPDGDPLTVTMEPTGPFTLGDTNVALIVTDACGASDTCYAVITVECPVAVELAAFSVAREASGAVLRWTVASAEDHAGFHVYRQVSGETRQQVSDRLLTGHREYEFVDPGAPSGRVDYWLTEISRTGETAWHGPVTLGAEDFVTAIVLSPAQPNPFRQATSIAYRLPGEERVRISVYDVRGRLVRTLVNETQGPGAHVTSWDGSTDAGSRAAFGQYLIRLEAENYGRTQKVAFVH